MNRYEMEDLVDSFDGELGLAVQHVARTLPEHLELCYEVVGRIRSMHAGRLG